MTKKKPQDPRKTAEFYIVHDPRRQFGAACIPDSRTPCTALAGAVWAGDGVADVADDYGVSPEMVRLACWYEVTFGEARRSKSRRKRNRAWADWAEKYQRWAGGWTNDHPGNPAALGYRDLAEGRPDDPALPAPGTSPSAAVSPGSGTAPNPQPCPPDRTRR